MSLPPPPGQSPYPPNQAQPGYTTAYPPPGPSAVSQASAQPGPYRRPPNAPVFSTPVPRPGERPAIFTTFALPVTTLSTVPGRTVAEVAGIVFGTASHAPGAPADATITARQEAIRAAVRMAQEAGADAMVGLSFDAYVAGPQVVVCATATAVRLSEREEPEA